ncbi:MAG: MerR family transcriptional regulator [Thermacetogeniaceae bacterium]
MDLRNCPECGRMFIIKYKNLCPNCIEQREADFKTIKDYLLINGHANVREINIKTGIPMRRMLRILHDERLNVILEKRDINVLKCKHCGAPISGGRFCTKCSDMISNICCPLLDKPKTKLTSNEQAGKQKRIFTKHFRNH